MSFKMAGKWKLNWQFERPKGSYGVFSRGWTGFGSELLGHRLYVFGGQSFRNRGITNYEDMYAYDIDACDWDRYKIEGEGPIRSHYNRNTAALPSTLINDNLLCWSTVVQTNSKECYLRFIDLSLMEWRKQPLLGTFPRGTTGCRAFLWENREIVLLVDVPSQDYNRSLIFTVTTDPWIVQKVETKGKGPDGTRNGNKCAFEFVEYLSRLFVYGLANTRENLRTQSIASLFVLDLSKSGEGIWSRLGPFGGRFVRESCSLSRCSAKLLLIGGTYPTENFVRAYDLEANKDLGLLDLEGDCPGPQELANHAVICSGDCFHVISSKNGRVYKFSNESLHYD